VDCGRSVHLCRAWKVLPLGTDRFRRRIPEIDHHLALALWVVVVRARSIDPVKTDPANAERSGRLWNFGNRGRCLHATGCARLLSPNRSGAQQAREHRTAE
jgi:hypothetical protein